MRGRAGGITLYLEALPNTEYETRIMVLRDLKRWQDAAAEPAVPHVRPRKEKPAAAPAGADETNASDPELCYFKGKTIVYFTGSDQQVAGDLQRAEFDGTPRELFEHFFEGMGEPAVPSSKSAVRRAVLSTGLTRWFFRRARPLQRPRYPRPPKPGEFLDRGDGLGAGAVRRLAARRVVRRCARVSPCSSGGIGVVSSPARAAVAALVPQLPQLFVVVRVVGGFTGRRAATLVKCLTQA